RRAHLGAPHVQRGAAPVPPVRAELVRADRTLDRGVPRPGARRLRPGTGNGGAGVTGVRAFHDVDLVGSVYRGAGERVPSRGFEPFPPDHEDMSRAVLIDGKAHAARLNDATGAEAIELLERHNVKPGLA